MSDDEIVRGLLAGGRQEDAALKALYDRYQSRMVSSFIYRGASAAEAEEIFQDTVVRIVRYAPQFRGQAATSWFWRIARSCWADCMRRERPTTRSYSANDDGYQALFVDIEEEIINETVAAIETPPPGESVDECVSEGLARFCTNFPERGQALIMQVDGATVQEIAVRLGRTPGAARVFLWDCRKKLAPFIEHCRTFLAA